MLKEGILFQIKNEGSTKTIMFHNSIDSLPHVHPHSLSATGKRGFAPNHHVRGNVGDYFLVGGHSLVLWVEHGGTLFIIVENDGSTQTIIFVFGGLDVHEHDPFIYRGFFNYDIIVI